MCKRKFWKLYTADLLRYAGKPERYIKKLLYFFRKAQTSSGINKLIYKFLLKIHRAKHGIELSCNTKVGKGLYIGHAYNITINERSILGDNINIHKGVTIGQENRGKRKGTPVIGNNVWIGINAAIVGNIKIGDDVLIAPNSYVNCDIPSHSIVFGNPCVIKHRDNATEDYVNNRV
ncbi:serine acetyltransferase [Ruminococcus sp.]|uniref:serine acetyltransferase n=1 Tax=Ruminococcus sp. TaxID=41978 RepID=UPI002674AFD6|nr:serine acetyltransferase [uncultured Ruminococcus sp.]